MRRSWDVNCTAWPAWVVPSLVMGVVVVMTTMAIVCTPPAQPRSTAQTSRSRETLESSLNYSSGGSWKEAQEADRVVALPGQPKVGFAMYGGYITVSMAGERALYYYFVEAEEEPEKKPLVFWFNGGPGCSSLAYGFAEELGPFFINPDKKTLRLNPNAGNRLANIVFIESPVGVGFSYTNTPNDLLTFGDNRSAQDNYAFVVNWMERFPQYKGRPFYLTGESYAGFFVPQLAKLVFDNNKKLSQSERINFKGFMVGNPVIERYFDLYRGNVDFLYYHAMISDALYSEIKTVCNSTRENQSGPLSEPCRWLLWGNTTDEQGRLDPYSVYAPACISSTTSAANSAKSQKPRKRLFNQVLGRFRLQGYDPCTQDHSLIYFNRPDVQKAMHANTTGISYPWVGCSDPLFSNWADTATSVLPIYRELLEAGLRISVFSGDADSSVATVGTRYALASLNLPVVVPWHSWYNKQQVGGREIVYQGNLTLVTVRGAGHEVPLLRPEEFLLVFGAFLNGSLLPTGPQT